MNRKERALQIVSLLAATYPDAICSLEYEKDYELLFATRLAAQCTDARVNIVTQTLYRAYPTLASFAEADIETLEQAVRPCGFYHVKARDIKACAVVLLAEHNGQVPDTMEALLKLPGVGRKTANLILGDIFGKGGIVVDTHCIRLSNRLGLAEGKNPVMIEKTLDSLIPMRAQSDFCHRLVLHGRAVCSARAPRCADCVLQGLCPGHVI